MVTLSDESMTVWRLEVEGLKCDRRRGYAAEGNEGMSSQSQLGFWTTYFQMKGMKLGLIPALWNCLLSSPPSNIDEIAMRWVGRRLFLQTAGGRAGLESDITQAGSTTSRTLFIYLLKMKKKIVYLVIVFKTDLKNNFNHF